MPEHTPAPTPGRAVYGFAMYLAFRICFILYLIWAIIPEKYFRAIGITCLPQRYWAVTVPIFFLTVLTLFAFIIYPSLGMIMTPSIGDIKTIKDKVSKARKNNSSRVKVQEAGSSGECVCKDKEQCYQECYKNSAVINSRKPIPPLEDLNMWEVSSRLYLR